MGVVTAVESGSAAEQGTDGGVRTLLDDGEVVEAYRRGSEQGRDGIQKCSPSSTSNLWDALS